MTYCQIVIYASLYAIYANSFLSIYFFKIINTKTLCNNLFQNSNLKQQNNVYVI